MARLHESCPNRCPQPGPPVGSASVSVPLRSSSLELRHQHGCAYNPTRNPIAKCPPKSSNLLPEKPTYVKSVGSDVKSALRQVNTSTDHSGAAVAAPPTFPIFPCSHWHRWCFPKCCQQHRVLHQNCCISALQHPKARPTPTRASLRAASARAGVIQPVPVI